MKRRNFLLTTGVIGLMAIAPKLGMAQDFDKLEIFIPADPGGGWDQTGRVMDEVMRGEGLINSSLITNVGGAGGTVGLPQYISRYDGNADSIMISGMVMIGAILSNSSAVDLSMVTPLARLTGEYLVVVVPAESEIQSLDDLIEKLKADPGAVSWAGGGAGGSDHILAGLIAREAGAKAVDVSWVAFGGGGEALAALIGNQVTCGISGWGEFAEQIAAGKLRAIAISAPERVEGLDVPTIMEQGLDIELLNWRGVFGAPNISDEDRARLTDLMVKMDESEAWQQQLKDRSWERLFLAGEEFDAYLKEDIERISGILQELGLAGG